MLRALAVYLCFASIVYASHSHHGYSSSFSSTVPPLDVSSVQPFNSIPIEAKILPSQLAANSEPLATYSTQYQRISTGEQAQAASPGITYTISPAVVKTLSAPTAATTADKVAAEALQEATAHPTTAPYVTSRPISVQPVYQNAQSVVHRPAFQYVTSTLPPQPIYDGQIVTHRPAVQYVPVTQASGVVNSVATVPVAANKITIEAHRSVIAHSSTPRPVQTVVNPSAVQIVSGSVAPIVPSSIPVATGIVQDSLIGYPPIAYVSPLAPQPVQYVQTVVNRPGIRYVSAPARRAKPVVIKPKTVGIETHKSVTAHPPTPFQQVQTVVHPPAVQYVSSSYPVNNVVTQQASSVVRHGASTVHTLSSTPAKPIPVPVIYTAEEAQGAQYTEVTKHIPPSSTVVTQHSSRVISRPIAYPKSAYVQYNNVVSSPVVYSKSLVQKDHVSADLVASNIRPGYGRYARPVVYSPASAVSSVSFNGLGVSYGW